MAIQGMPEAVDPQSEYSGPRDRTWVPLAERIGDSATV
jgi:hypothetical protein